MTTSQANRLPTLPTSPAIQLPPQAAPNGPRSVFAGPPLLQLVDSAPHADPQDWGRRMVDDLQAFLAGALAAPKLKAV